MTPQGIVAILVTKEGRVVASATDFHAGCHGGFSKKEAQTIRASARLAVKAVEELSSPLMRAAVGKYEAQQILNKMCENGCRVEIVSVGYDESGQQPL